MHHKSASHEVVVLAIPPVVAFDFAIPGQVFARAELQDHYHVTAAAATPGRVATHTGFDLSIGHGLDAIARADTVIVPGFSLDSRTPDEVCDVLRAARTRGARLASICTGAFALAAAGLLDGRAATTHWMHGAELVRRHPAVSLQPGVLYTEDDGIFTSAGVAAGIDLCLHLLEVDLGPRVALDVARA